MDDGWVELAVGEEAALLRYAYLLTRSASKNSSPPYRSPPRSGSPDPLVMEPIESVRRRRRMLTSAMTAGLLVALSVSLSGCSTHTGSTDTDTSDDTVTDAEASGYVHLAAWGASHE